VVLPVPALPVRKMLVPVFSTKCHAISNSLFVSIVFFSIAGAKVIKSITIFKYFARQKPKSERFATLLQLLFIIFACK
jgi:hypothetical protein